MMRTLLLCLVVATFANAQNPPTATATVPVVVTAQDVDRPFPGGIGRYQQWFSAPSLQAQIPEPMRIDRIEFFAGSSLSSNATTINCEILLGHGFASGVTGLFGNNFATPPVIVLPQQNVTLSAGAPGTVVMNIPLTTLFTWDRVHPLVMEIKIFGNGFSNQPFIYNFRGTTASIGQTTRVYQGGSAGATSGTTQQGVGMIVRFSARQGVLIDFGAGCAGGGNVVPVNKALQIMRPGIAWQHEVQNAASQAIALWVMGTSDTLWDTAPLPLDLSALLTGNAQLCMMRTEPTWLFAVVTVGGGPGGGLGQFTFQLPGTTSYVGSTFFTQWIVLDSLAPNGLLTTTQGIKVICSP